MVTGFGPQPTRADLERMAVKSARKILADHAGCYCDLCELARNVELRLTGVSYER